MLQMQHLISFLLKFKSDLLVTAVFFLVIGTFAMTILDLICVQFVSFVIMLFTQLNYCIPQLFLIYKNLNGR